LKRAAKLLTRGQTVSSTELVDTSTRIDDLLLTGVERMACGADFHMQILAQRRARREFITATASNLDLAVVWVNVGFHRIGFVAGRVRILLARAEYKWHTTARSSGALSTKSVHNSVDIGSANARAY
jgi:hypothetical protein